MNSSRFNNVLKRLVAGIVLSASLSLTAQALTKNIDASFRPDAANPQMNKFRNDTPVTGVCAGHMPARCEAMNIFSIRDDMFKANSNGPLLADAADPRQGAMFKMPSDWRRFQVTHTETGEVETVEMRIAGVGVRSDLPTDMSHHKVWVGGQGSWSHPKPPNPCQSTGYVIGTPWYILWHWIVPERAGVCAVAAQVEIPELTYQLLEYSYELRTPNPLTMSTGNYTGSVTYTMGPGQDFDFGDIMIPNDTLYTFNFNLSVQHTLKVEVPPGGHRVELLPQGGWQAWLNQGRRPTRLFRDQTFNLSASSRFKMNLECQYVSGNNCALLEPNVGHVVPLEVSVTLPSGLTDASNEPVNRRPLRRDGVGTELFQPGIYVDRKPGTLHFEVPRDDVEEMINQGTARHYSGNVTVIWDSQV
ncbi:hypothetical protein [Pseudomonas fluorescens]|uniref:hypothetical protein n=1 Tax=Pseudomonas fluorescens TaxID=294 RepID=UPI0012410EAB|nr:hypothetical protein [Pseudomonas fluorescens]VVO75680.1 hypothetical protein PS898_01537 [Pseudomonas fluorescens]